MNKKQFQIWEKQKWKDFERALSELQNDFANRGLAYSGMRNKAEKDLKERYKNEIEIARLGIEHDPPNVSIITGEVRNSIVSGNTVHYSKDDSPKGPNWGMWGVIAAIVIAIIGWMWFTPKPTPYVSTQTVDLYPPNGGANVINLDSMGTLYPSLLDSELRNGKPDPSYSIALILNPTLLLTENPNGAGSQAVYPISSSTIFTFDMNPENQTNRQHTIKTQGGNFLVTLKYIMPLSTTTDNYSYTFDIVGQ